MIHSNKELVIFMPSIEDGGVEKNLFNITNYLSKKNININLITSNNNKKIFFDKKVKYICPKFNFLNFKFKRLKILLCIYLLFSHFVLKKKKIIILSFQANIYSLIFAKFFNIKIIVRSNTSPSGWNKNFFKKNIIKYFYKRADKVIVNSAFFKKEMNKEMNIKSHLIYNPLDANTILNKSKKKVNFNFYKSSTLNLINIARLSDQKDHYTILKAVNLIRKKIKLRLLIIGKGKEFSNLKIYIKKNNLCKIVKFLGFKKNPYPYLKKSDVFILSSKFEGLPNVLLEAAYFNKYIISSDCPTGPKEILKDYRFGSLFKIGDHKRLSELILNYYFKVNKTNNFSNLMLKKFNFRNNCENYFKIVKSYL
jgi:hypothetical protein